MPGRYVLHKMDSDKTVITDKFSYYMTWFLRFIVFVFPSGLYLELLSLIDFKSFFFTAEIVVYLILFILLAIYAIKVFVDFSAITRLSISDSGIHSKNEDVKWDQIRELYWKEKSGLPFLFVEFEQNEETFILKTVLKIHEGKKRFEKIERQFLFHQNT